MKRSTLQFTLLSERFSHLAKLFFVGIFLISQLGAFAQTREVSGTVTGTDGAPIPGLTVIVKGTTIGSITNPDGVLYHYKRSGGCHSNFFIRWNENPGSCSWGSNKS